MTQGGHVVDQQVQSATGGAPVGLDTVTGAYPRSLLLPRLTQELAHGVPFAVFLFDVDYFKTVNDAYGHLRGDEVLAQLARRITDLVRGADELFRYGGDEFVLLMPGTGPAEALRLALRVTDGVRANEFPGEPPLRVSVSLGVATYPQDGTTAEGLIATADRRNYLAKRRGRGGAVADDADTPVAETAGETSTRLWERDAALATAHDYLTRLRADGRGALCVRGEPGSGHTRFLAEIATVARMRGYDVRRVTDPGGPGDADTLLIADTVDGPVIAGAVSALARGPGALGLVYAATTATGPDPVLPVLAAVDLDPWSPAALKIWLRASLHGEPSRTLVSWIARNTGGLPAAAARELSRLRGRSGLVPTGSGGWTVAPSVLGRPRRRTTLPAPMTPLVGRATERDRVVRLLDTARLVTLIGPGGIGKTRLSLAAATAVAERFDDGAVFVPLADIHADELVMPAIAHALHVPEVPGEPLAETLAEHLADATLLLVLDNFEQVVGAAADLGRLLAAAPNVAALVTSRERLSLYGEQVYRVPPLAVPDLSELPEGAEGVARALAESPAVALFAQRARACEPDFELTPDTLPAVTALCRRLDGLPLAIELAAARIDAWSPRALLMHLGEHLDTLGEGPRDLPARQQTLRGAIDWSYDLLPPADQRLFAALAAFAGGFTAESALAVAEPAVVDGARRTAALAERLASLVDKSLLTVEGSEAGQHRYGMLETIRAYAAARLAESTEADGIRARHSTYFAAFASEAAAGLMGSEQAEWSDRIEREYQNLGAASAWSLADDAERAAAICLGLWRFWRHGSHIGEGRERCEQVLAGTLPDGKPRAMLLHAAAVLATTQDDHETATRYGHACLALAGALGDEGMKAHARNVLGIAAVGSGDYDLATVHFQASLTSWHGMGDDQGTAMALGNLTKVALRLGDIEAAGRYADQCLKLERAAGNTRGISMALECLAQIRLARGEIDPARAASTEALALSREIGDMFGEASALHYLGLTARAAGDRTEALRRLTAALALRHEVGDREDLALSLDHVAAIVVESDPELAIRLVGAAGAVRERHHLPIPHEAEVLRKPTLATARAILGEGQFVVAWAAGRSTPLDLVVDQVLDAVADGDPAG
jgi:diguanylate cyclase (GGDEF)-like protein